MQAFVPHPRHGPGGTPAETDLSELQYRFHVRPHEKPSPLYMGTLGLSKCYERVGARRGKSPPRGGWGQDVLYTSEDGTLRLGPHLPLFMNRYRFLGLLGQGTFSQIVCAEDTYHPDRRQVALKILNFHYSEIGKREAVCLRLMHARPEGRHCALLRFDSAFDFLGHFVLVLELCQGGSLHSFLGPSLEPSPSPSGRRPSHSGGLSLPQIRDVTLQLVKGLLLLHHHDIIHADLKLENVLLAGHYGHGAIGPMVRLTDLGNAIKLREVKLYRDDYEIQTISYRAPEVLMGGSGGGAFDNKIDMWSLGVMLVELYLGRPLFRASCRLLMVKRLLSILGPLPARVFVTGRFYNGYFGADHRLRPEVLSMKDDPVQEATATIDPSGVQNVFRYSKERHYQLVCELLRCRDSDFISFIASLLQLDPSSRLSSLDALLHPFLSPCFPFALLRPYLPLTPSTPGPPPQPPACRRLGNSVAVPVLSTSNDPQTTANHPPTTSNHPPQTTFSHPQTTSNHPQTPFTQPKEEGKPRAQAQRGGEEEEGEEGAHNPYAIGNEGSADEGRDKEKDKGRRHDITLHAEGEDEEGEREGRMEGGIELSPSETESEGEEEEEEEACLYYSPVDVEGKDKGEEGYYSPVVDHKDKGEGEGREEGTPHRLSSDEGSEGPRRFIKESPLVSGAGAQGEEMERREEGQRRSKTHAFLPDEDVELLPVDDEDDDPPHPSPQRHIDTHDSPPSPPRDLDRHGSPCGSLVRPFLYPSPSQLGKGGPPQSFQGSEAKKKRQRVDNNGTMVSVHTVEQSPVREPLPRRAYHQCRDPRRLATLQDGEGEGEGGLGRSSKKREYAYLRQDEARGDAGEVKVAVVTLLPTGQGQGQGERGRAVSFERRHDDHTGDEDEDDALIL